MDLFLHCANIDDSTITSAMVVATLPKRHTCKIAYSSCKELITRDFCNIDNLLRLRGSRPRECEKLAEHNEPYSHDHLLIFSGFFILREENTSFDPNNGIEFVAFAETNVAGDLSVMSWLASDVSSYGLDLTGAWATDPSVCGKLFTKKGNRIAFISGSSIFGGGFVVEGNQIIGQLMKCHIKSKEEKGSQLHLSATCLTDIITGKMQFRAKVID
jgi:hypothetical protein